MALTRPAADRPRPIAVRGQGGAVPLSPKRNPTAQVPLPADDEPTAIDATPED